MIHCLRTDVLSICSHVCTLEYGSTHGINVLSKLMMGIMLTIRYLGVFNHVFVIECWRDGTQQGQSMSLAPRTDYYDSQGESVSGLWCENYRILQAKKCVKKPQVDKNSP